MNPIGHDALVECRTLLCQPGTGPAAGAHPSRAARLDRKTTPVPQRRCALRPSPEMNRNK
jgi:hypothetical protein